MDEGRHRIAFAYFLKDWVYGKGNVSHLKDVAQPITPKEFLPEMKGWVFCPECSTPLSRAPNEEDLFTNNRSAHFRHKGKYKHISCSLRVPKASGLNYQTEEEVRRAIQQKDLIVIHEWMSSPPENAMRDPHELMEFNQTQIEDPEGPITEKVLNRHTGAKFFVPTKISSVLSLCRNFDQNLHRVFFFPDSQYATYLSDKLLCASSIVNPLPSSSNLFFGEIVGYRRLTARNVIFISVQNFREFKIYTWPTYDERKNINERSIGSTLLFYGKLHFENGEVPRCFMQQWGQYSVLPKEYEKFLLDFGGN